MLTTCFFFICSVLLPKQSSLKIRGCKTECPSLSERGNEISNNEKTLGNIAEDEQQKVVNCKLQRAWQLATFLYISRQKNKWRTPLPKPKPNEPVWSRRLYATLKINPTDPCPRTICSLGAKIWPSTWVLTRRRV